MSSLTERMKRKDQDPRVEAVDGVRRYWDPKFGATAVKVLPGEHYVTDKNDEMLVTVLGSCIAACVRDPETGRGGMNHFIFPGGNDGPQSEVTIARRYGTHAMEKLINDVLRRGGSRRELEVKIFGGANVIRSTFKVGSNNVSFIHDYLEREGMRIAGEDVGGLLPRRIHYFPATGKVMRLFLRRQDDTEVFHREVRLRDRVASTAPAGDVELFE